MNDIDPRTALIGPSDIEDGLAQIEIQLEDATAAAGPERYTSLEPALRKAIRTSGNATQKEWEAGLETITEPSFRTLYMTSFINAILLSVAANAAQTDNNKIFQLFIAVSTIMWVVLAAVGVKGLVDMNRAKSQEEELENFISRPENYGVVSIARSLLAETAQIDYLKAQKNLLFSQYNFLSTENSLSPDSEDIIMNIVNAAVIKDQNEVSLVFPERTLLAHPKFRNRLIIAASEKEALGFLLDCLPELKRPTAALPPGEATPEEIHLTA